jgi:DNA-binding LytR/AlgR family response regulator
MEQAEKLSGAEALRGVRVLVVEDDLLLLMELESVLLDAGAEIAGLCRTFADALTVTDENGVSAAILDVRVGRDTIAPVARRLANRGTPFFFYTGQIENDPALTEWKEHKILSKPARRSAIVAAVADLLNESGG